MRILTSPINNACGFQPATTERYLLDNSIATDTKRSGCLPMVLIVVAVSVLTAGLTVWLAKIYLFPDEFRPVHLNAREESVLDAKMQVLASRGAGTSPDDRQNETEKNRSLAPEPYTEVNARREIQLTERELNALLARNTDLAKKLSIDLSEDLASAKILLPLDPEFPLLGGKTLKVTAGLELRYAAGKPVVKLKGISVWGVPIPNAWLGGMKNIDLVQEFGMHNGFWRAFSAGIENIRVVEGRVSIKLKE